MSGDDAKKQPNVVLTNEDALHEILVAALTLSMQIGAEEASEHILDALRALHNDDGCAEGGVLDAGVH